MFFISETNFLESKLLEILILLRLFFGLLEYLKSFKCFAFFLDK